ncbi:MAG: reverse transcriptase-like protein [Archaeoglobaceae archaeon]
MRKRGKKAYIDGSSTGLYGFLLEGEKPVIFREEELTNNQAEWLALYSLVVSLPEGWKGIVYSDSQLVVNQFSGAFKINAPHLQEIHDIVQDICKIKNLSLELVWIPREKNVLGKIMDKLVQRRERSEDFTY